MIGGEIQKRLTDLDEDNFVERKTGRESKSQFVRTIVAFANSVPEGQEAVLYLGVRNDGTVCGLVNPDKLQKTVREICSETIYPPVEFQTHVKADAEQRKYLAVVVPFSQRKPHFGGPAWVREGSQTVAASERLFEELIHSRTNKCYEILKWKDRAISVVIVTDLHGQALMPSAPDEYFVIDCNCHYVRLQKAGSGAAQSDSIENVTLTRDEVRKRLLLSIRRLVL